MPLRPLPPPTIVPRPRLIPRHLLQPSSPFHTLPSRRAQAASHYEVLNVPPDASQATIKKQFYQLSKQHHPDRNPTDPTASSRFVAISTAYNTLSSPSARAAYDKTLFGTSHFSSTPHNPRGSHSSAQSGSGAWGARPATGLSKRRGTFRGPPPSFYRSGGWGAQAGKRRGHAEEAEEAARGKASASSSSAAGGGGEAEGAGGGAAPGGGFGYGQWGAGEEVPHFDRREHFRRQEAEDERGRRRRRAQAERIEKETAAAEGDVVFKAVMVVAVLGVAWSVPIAFSGRGKKEKE